MFGKGVCLSENSSPTNNELKNENRKRKIKMLRLNIRRSMKWNEMKWMNEYNERTKVKNKLQILLFFIVSSFEQQTKNCNSTFTVMWTIYIDMFKSDRKSFLWLPFIDINTKTPWMIGCTGVYFAWCVLVLTHDVSKINRYVKMELIVHFSFFFFLSRFNKKCWKWSKHIQYFEEIYTHERMSWA